MDATEKATLSTASAFYTWWGDQEAAVLREKETKYKRYAAELEDGLGRCRALSAEIDGVIGLLDDLRALHRSVRGKTQSLTGACDRLVDEQRRLAAFADALRGKLEYFDELERLAPGYRPDATAALEVFYTKFETTCGQVGKEKLT